MHETFVFNMECTGFEKRWDRIVYIDKNKGIKQLFGDGKEGTLSYYNPFDYDHLIPEFVEMVEKVLTGGNLEKGITKWLSEWGPLHFDYDKHTIKYFWDESLRFYKLWCFYRLIANRDKKGLMESIQIKKDGDHHVLTFFPEDDSFKSEEFSFFEPEYDFKVTFPIRIDREKDEFTQIQEHSMFFLLSQIEEYTANAKLSWGTMKHEKDTDKSNFKITPVLRTENLIDAIYLQFFILFSENEKKICPVCNTPFVPARIDKKYCSDSCKLTAKSRRYRARKTS